MVRTGRNAGNFEFAAYRVVLALLIQDITSLTCHHFFLHNILYHSGLTLSGDVKIVGCRVDAFLAWTLFLFLRDFAPVDVSFL
jgi:hypothetical protein